MADSKLYTGEQVITDMTPFARFNPGQVTRGYDGMFRRGRQGFAGAEFFPSSMVMSASEIEQRAHDSEKNGTRFSDHIVQLKLPPKNQDSTNYCWMNAPIGIVELLRGIAGEPYEELSPASAAAPFTNFRNQGGFGEDAVTILQNKGCLPVSIWPANTWNNKKLWTTENQKKALDYRITEWYKLDPDPMVVASAVLQGFPVAVGYDWWGHEVYVVDIVYINGKMCFRCRNSWGDIAEYPNGLFILSGKKMIPQDAVAPRVVTAA